MVKKHDQNIIKNRLTIFGLTSIFMGLNTQLDIIYNIYD